MDPKPGKEKLTQVIVMCTPGIFKLKTLGLITKW